MHEYLNWTSIEQQTNSVSNSTPSCVASSLRLLYLQYLNNSIGQLVTEAGASAAAGTASAAGALDGQVRMRTVNENGNINTYEELNGIDSASGSDSVSDVSVNSHVKVELVKELLNCGPLYQALFHWTAFSDRSALNNLYSERNEPENENDVTVGCNKGMDDSDYEIINREWLTAIMTNPPFYDLYEEVKKHGFGLYLLSGCSLRRMHLYVRCVVQIFANQRTVCTGSINEMRTVGGEIAFVCAIIADSLIIRDR